MTNGAGSAAMAALRLHQNSSPLVPQSQPQQRQQQQQQHRQSQPRHRPQSQVPQKPARSNSLKTYVYHPKGSYTPGNANPRRYSSLNSSSFTPPQPVALRRVSSLTSQNLAKYDSKVYEENSEEEGEMVITTQTTKVVDSQGRVLSITTKTIKTLPDGSNIIETTTKNISRGNSRANSMRNNSIISGKDQYNLQKIDEDLRDFEYDYELDHNLQPPIVSGDHETRDASQLESDMNHNAESLNLNVEPRSNSFVSKKSTDSSPIRPLKSILKSSRPEFEDEKSQHPYKALGSVETQGINNFGSPKAKSQKVASPTVNSPLTKSPVLSQGPLLSPTSKYDDLRSNASVTASNNSIKFDDKVETIPIYQTDFKPKKQMTDADMYNKALAVATEKILGSSQRSNSLKSADQSSGDVQSRNSKERHKLEKKLEILGHSGVNDNYVYENHHKDFSSHSMRDNLNAKAPSRKERAKEEKRLQKEREKQLKLEEKQRKEEEKQKAKELKAQNRASKGGLFRRKRRNSASDTITLGSDISSLTENSPASQSGAQALPSSVASSPAKSNQFETIPEGKAVLEGPERTIPEQAIPEQAIPEQAVESPKQTAHTTTGPVPETTIPILEKPVIILSTEKSIDNIDTPLIEPTINLEPTEKSEKSDLILMESDARFKSNNVDFNEPEHTPSETSTGIPEEDLKEIVEEVKSKDIEPVIPVQPAISQPIVNDRLSGSSPSIARPILVDVADHDTTDDNGLLSSEEDDGLRSPSSKRLDAQDQFYEARGGESVEDSGEESEAFEPKEVVTEPQQVEPETSEPDSLNHDEVPVEQGKTIVELEQGTPAPEDVTTADAVPRPVYTFQPGTEPEVPQRSSKRNAPVDLGKQYSLADLIKMGRTGDTTEESFMSPDIHNDSDSDVSSRFSADLNAALKRITDDTVTGSGKDTSASAMIDVDKSAPATESSDDRSPQPSASTTATKEAVKAPEMVTKDMVPEKTKGSLSSPKKKRFRTKILKLFVNSYDH